MNGNRGYKDNRLWQMKGEWEERSEWQRREREKQQRMVRDVASDRSWKQILQSFRNSTAWGQSRK